MSEEQIRNFFYNLCKLAADQQGLELTKFELLKRDEDAGEK